MLLFIIQVCATKQHTEVCSDVKKMEIIIFIIFHFNRLWQEIMPSELPLIGKPLLHRPKMASVSETTNKCMNMSNWGLIFKAIVITQRNWLDVDGDHYPCLWCSRFSFSSEQFSWASPIMRPTSVPWGRQTILEAHHTLPCHVTVTSHPTLLAIKHHWQFVVGFDLVVC